MNLGRALLEEIVPVRENPLGLIGLSPQILRLNLTNDELYSAARRLAKSLLATVHEDRVAITPRTRHLQFRFSRAMQALKTQDTFERALREFRAEINTDDSEREQLRREIIGHQLRVAQLENQNIELRNEIKMAHRQAGASTQRRVVAETGALKSVSAMKAEVQEARAFERGKLRKNIKRARAFRVRIVKYAAAQAKRKIKYGPILDELKAEIKRLRGELAISQKQRRCENGLLIPPETRDNG